MKINEKVTLEEISKILKDMKNLENEINIPNNDKGDCFKTALRGSKVYLNKNIKKED